MTLDSAALTNIVIDIFSAAVTLIMLSGFRDREKWTAQTRLFLGMMICNAIALVTDMISWMTDGMNLTAVSFGVNLLSYIAGYCMGACYVMYVIEYTRIEEKKKYNLHLFAAWLCLIASLSAVVGMATGTYLREEDGYWIPGTFNWLSQAMSAMFLIAAIMVVIIQRKSLLKTDLTVFILYAIMPLAATALQTVYSGVVLIYAATTLSLLAVYTVVFVQQRNRLAIREAELKEAKLDMAISQIQPHFLYNSLNSIAQLCAIAGASEAEQATVEFARYLRGNLETLGTTAPVPFARELGHTQTYAKLEKLRFGDQLTLEYDIGAVNFTLPALTLQPLVENAIKHGLGAKAGGGTVTVKSFEGDNGFYVTVEDNGVGFCTANPPKPKGRTSIGIDNVRTRLRYRVGGTLTVESTPGVGTQATIYIPK